MRPPTLTVTLILALTLTLTLTLALTPTLTLTRRDILARVFGGGGGPTPRQVAPGRKSEAGLEAVPAGTVHEKTTLGPNGAVLTPMRSTFLSGGPQTGGKLVGTLMPDGMVVAPSGALVGRRNPKSGAVRAAPAGEVLHANTTVWLP